MTTVDKRTRLKELLAARSEGQGLVLYPLSKNQASLWFLHQIAPESSAYSVGFAGRTRSGVDEGRLGDALAKLAARHPSLRTVFRDVRGRALQEVRPDAALALEVVDAAGLDDDALMARVQRDYEQPFALASAPGARAVLYRVAPDDHVLLLVVHHTLLDLWGLSLVLADLGALYADPDAELSPTGSDYAQFVRWQSAFQDTEDGERQRDYWRRELDGVDAVLNLPTDRPRQPLQTLRGDSVTFTIDPSLTSALNALAREERASTYALLLAAFHVLLSRYTEQEDILVGSPVAGRSRPEFEGVVGHFVNMIVLRGRMYDDPPFREFLRQMRDAALGAVEHQDFPFADLVEALQLPRDPSRPALFQACFAYQRAPKLEGLTGFMVRAPGAPPLDLGGLVLEPFPLSQQQGQFDLSLWMAEAEGALHGEIKFNGDLFDRATAERMASHFTTLLASIAEDADRPVSALDLLPAEERALVVDEWNDTAAPWRDGLCMHQSFEQQADRSADALAVVGADGTRLTYREVEEQANRLAHLLRSAGVGAKGLVAVYLERGVEIPSTVLGIHKAGAGYVPLETHWPDARIDTILSSLPIRAVVTNAEHVKTLQQLDAPLVEHLVCVDEDPSAPEGRRRVWGPSDLAAQPSSRPDNVSAPEDTAYIIFTSGSTGAPKGVEVTHKPAVNLIDWVNTTFSVGPGDLLLFVTSLCFDLSVYDVFGSLAAGAAVRVASGDEVRDPERLMRVVAEEGITFWDSAPPALGQLVPFLPDSPLADSPLRLVFLSGDWIPVRLPDTIRAVFPRAHVVSLGGATEATIWSNWYPIGDVAPEWVSIPYGKPITNARYYVLDKSLNPCPIGVPGDLYIGGPVLASGYVNDPDLTAGKFIPDPFVPGGTMYRTGDRSRWWADGNLEFLGRQDFQVKIRGYRIELGEIESVLALHPGVAECLVMARSDAGPEKYLAAYVVPSDAATPPSVTDLRGFLREKLPDYMVPPSYVFLDRMPVTPNGKVDRKALPAPELRRDQVGGEFVPPRTPLEEALAAIFAGVLGADRVGVTDDFFDLGGNSLRAVEVVHAVESQLGTRLSVSALLQAPTVADLAGLVGDADEAQPARSALVTLQSGARGVAPLVLFHPAGGDVAVYRGLREHAPSDWPVAALPSRAASGESAEYASFPEMADAYAVAVRSEYPDGPWRLAGWSMGGVLAHAVAARLEAEEGAGSVLSVALWDSAVPAAAAALRDSAAFRLSEWFGSLAGALLSLPEDEREAEASKLLSLPESRRVGEAVAWAKARGLLQSDAPDDVIVRHVELSRVHDGLLRRYALEEVPVVGAPLHVAWAAGSLDADGRAPMDWATFTSAGVVVETTVPGHHFDVVNPPAAASLPLG